MAINYHNKKAQGVLSKKPHLGMWQAADHRCHLASAAGRAGAMTDRACPTGWWLEQALRLSGLVPAFLASSGADVANRRDTAAGEQGVSSNTPSGHTAACRIRKRERKRDINHDCCIVPRSGAAAPRQQLRASMPRVGTLDAVV